MEDLAGKVAVVTGGAMGERFAAEGMRVVLADVEEGALDETVAELRSRSLEVTGVVTDVARYESVEALRDRALAAYGAVHLLCNNAGIGAGAEGPLWEHERNDWRWAMGVNVYGVIHGINAFVPGMVASGEEGHVVNTSSGNGGISPLRGTPQYAVTKAAVVITVQYTEPAEVADQVVRGVRAGDFWILAASERIDEQIRARAESMVQRSNPTYLREVPG